VIDAREQLTAWMHDGVLPRGKFGTALRIAGVTPAPAQWRTFAERMLVWMGMILVAAAAACFRGMSAMRVCENRQPFHSVSHSRRGPFPNRADAAGWRLEATEVAAGAPASAATAGRPDAVRQNRVHCRVGRPLMRDARIGWSDGDSS